MPISSLKAQDWTSAWSHAILCQTYSWPMNRVVVTLASVLMWEHILLTSSVFTLFHFIPTSSGRKQLGEKSWFAHLPVAEPKETKANLSWRKLLYSTAHTALKIRTVLLFAAQLHLPFLASKKSQGEFDVQHQPIKTSSCTSPLLHNVLHAFHELGLHLWRTKLSSRDRRE